MPHMYTCVIPINTNAWILTDRSAWGTPTLCSDPRRLGAVLFNPYFFFNRLVHSKMEGLFYYHFTCDFLSNIVRSFRIYPFFLFFVFFYSVTKRENGYHQYFSPVSFVYPCTMSIHKVLPFVSKRQPSNIFGDEQNSAFISGSDLPFQVFTGSICFFLRL